MKKITLIILCLFLSEIAIGQQILSHSLDNVAVTSGGVACAGGGTTADNIFSRSYTPSDFSFTGTFYVFGARFIPAFTDVSGGADVDYTVRISTTDAAYPGGTLTMIGEQTLTVTAAENGIVQEVLLAAPVSVNATDEIVIEIDVPDNVDPEMFDARIGVNSAGQNAPSYISSLACGITTPTDFVNVGGGFPDNHLILDLIGDDNLSTTDFSLDKNSISLYPNPTKGNINLNFSKDLGSTSVSIINIIGQTVLKTNVDGNGLKAINTNGLAAGAYFAQIATNTGKTTIKFIKQ